MKNKKPMFERKRVSLFVSKKDGVFFCFRGCMCEMMFVCRYECAFLKKRGLQINNDKRGKQLVSRETVRAPNRSTREKICRRKSNLKGNESSRDAKRCRKKKKCQGKKDSECCRPFLLLQFERREVEHLRGVRRCHSCLRFFPLQMTHNAHTPQEPAFRISIILFFFV